MICNNCNSMLPENSTFCPNCGATVNTEQYETEVLSDVGDTTVLNRNEQTNNYSYTNQGAYYNPNSQQNNTQQQYSNYQQNPQQYSQQQYGNYNQYPPQQNNMYPPQGNFAQGVTSYKDFFKRFASKKARNYMNTLGAITILTALISIYYTVMLSYICVLDVIVYAILSVLIFTQKHWVVTLITACYGGVATLIAISTTGKPSGIFALVISILATVASKKVSDAYKNYKATGTLPNSEI